MHGQQRSAFILAANGRLSSLHRNVIVSARFSEAATRFASAVCNARRPTSYSSSLLLLLPAAASERARGECVAADTEEKEEEEEREGETSFACSSRSEGASAAASTKRARYGITPN